MLPRHPSICFEFISVYDYIDYIELIITDCFSHEKERLKQSNHEV